MRSKRNYLNYSIFRDTKSPFWQGQIRVEGRRISFSTKITAIEENKELALELTRARYYKELKHDKLGIKEKQILTMSQAFGTYLEYEKDKLSSGWLRTVNSAMDSYLSFFTPAMRFDELTTSGLATYLKFRNTLSNATKNRYIAVIRRVVNFMDDFDQSIPDIKFKALISQEPDSRTREISREDFAKLFGKLPEHAKPIVLFAILTGLRKNNILTLDWKQINLFKGIITVSVKSKRPGGKSLTVPISNACRELLVQLEPQKSGRVFLYEGKPINDVKKSFKTARHEIVKGKKVCWLPDFRFHDLRHSFACWFINEGGSLKEIQDALGHADPRTTQKYARIKKETLKNSLDKVTSFGQIGWNKKVSK